jgi:glutathione S-transferase
LSCEEREVGFSKSPSKKRSEYKRDVVAYGLDSGFVKEAVEHHEKLLTAIEDAVHTAPYLAGDAYSLADLSVIPYILRLELLRLSRMWDGHPGVASWWERVRRRPSAKEAIFERMTDADTAPFKNLQPDPWTKVRELLNAA